MKPFKGLFLIILLIFGGILFWQKNSLKTLPKTENYNLEEKQLSDGELKDMLGQMLLVGFRGTQISASSSIAKEIKELNIGGVILFDYDVPSKSYPRNIVNPGQVKKLITDLQSFSKNPLFIAVDAEGGQVNRLKPAYGFSNVPSAAYMGTQSIAYTNSVAENLGAELASLGFNLDFAPVVDVNVNPQNPIIGALDRSFSADPNKVASYAEAFIGGLHGKKIMSAIKHFPGHGSSEGDTHKGIVDITSTYKEYELEPFRNLIKKNLPDMVMTAHIINTNIDPDYPATLSPKYVQDLLRGKLGFKGVVVSDDMQMKAILDEYSLEKAAVLAVKAGADILIISNNVSVYDEAAPRRVRDALFESVKKGEIPLEAIRASSERIQNLKKSYLSTYSDR